MDKKTIMEEYAELVEMLIEAGVPTRILTRAFGMTGSLRYVAKQLQKQAQEAEGAWLLSRDVVNDMTDNENSDESLLPHCVHQATRSSFVAADLKILSNTFGKVDSDEK